MQTIKKIREKTTDNIEKFAKNNSADDMFEEIQTVNQLIKACAGDVESLDQFSKKEEETFKDIYGKYSKELDIERNNLETLKLEEAEDEKTLADLTNKLERLKSNKHEEEANTHVELKNTVKAFKVLTNTKFIYSCKNVTGVLKSGRDGDNSLPRSFDFNKNKFTQEEITNNLWKMMEEVAGEDWSDVINLT